MPVADSQLPQWISVLTALLTPTIAVGVAVIGLMQWRTQNQKVVLDLFDRRLSVYKQLEEAAATVIVAGTAKGTNARALARDAMLDARFLFREDVFAKICELNAAIIALDPQSIEADEAAQLFVSSSTSDAEAMDLVRAFMRDMPNTFEAHLRMRQTL